MITGSDALQTSAIINAFRGASFYGKVVSVLFNGNDFDEIEEKSLESQINFFIKRNKDIEVLKISNYFKVHPKKILKILSSLKEQNKIILLD